MNALLSHTSINRKKISSSDNLSPLLGYFLLVVTLFFSFFGINTANASGEDFYYKNSYGRGVGVVLTQYCTDSNKHIEAGLCYDNARPGYNCNGTATCVADCPSGYSASGLLLCHYNGTALYTPGSHWDSCDHRTSRSCTRIFGKEICVGGDCIGALKQDDCRDGYQKIALSCNKTLPAGFSGSPGDPMRPTYSRGAGTVPALRCPSDHPDNNASLCYVSCRSGYKGVGPVCWGNTPSGYINCGAGYAKDKATCTSVTVGMTMSIVSLGIDGVGAIFAPEAPTGDATAAAKVAKNKAALQAEQNLAKDPVKASKFIQDVGPLLKKFQPVVDSMSNAVKDVVKSQVAGKVGDFAGALKNIVTNKAFTDAWGATNNFMGVYGLAQPSADNPGQSADEKVLSQVRSFTGNLSLMMGIAAMIQPEGGFGNPPFNLISDALGIVGSFAYPVLGQ